jgi:multidrug efflux pump subunit AcrB
VNSIPGVRGTLVDPSQQGFSASRGGGFPVELTIRGRDWNVLAESTQKVMDEMVKSGLVTDVDSDYQVGMPEVRVIPDRNKAADLGITMADIGQTINAAIGGQRVGKFKDQGRRFDIRVRLLAQQRERPEDIERLFVRTSSGNLVRLGDIVTIVQQPTL